ncbi:MAG: nascent polypeptide-associated complex protein [Candidatus Nanoarchaeia archaeon]|nr:nascent polypeptide-associated complex protein [Candidatus Nanoarchaeia archaeon]
MFGGINPKQMQSMMKQMGIAQEEINAFRVIFETKEGNYVINNPSVIKIKMQGQTSYQVSGDEHFEEMNEEKYTEEDINLVIEKTNKSKEEVIEVLEKTNGDIAESIILLSEL